MSFYHNRMILLLISSVIILSSCANKTTVKDAITLPRYCGNQVTVIHDDIPIFTNEEISTTKNEVGYFTFSNLDSLSRCGTATAILTNSNISNKVEDLGDTDIIPNGYIEHDEFTVTELIPHDAISTTANVKNVIAVCNQFKEEQQKIENEIIDYIKDTGNSVFYKVTPLYREKDIVVSGVLFEATSLINNKSNLHLYRYVYNEHPDYLVDFKNAQVIGLR